MTFRDCGVIRCSNPAGGTYHLPCAGVVSYVETSDPDRLLVRLSMSAGAVLIVGTLAAMDAAYSAAAQCSLRPLRAGGGASAVDLV